MKFAKLIALTILSYNLLGCSVYMASHQPPEKNIALFKVGTPRSFLLAEFGQPVSTTVINGKTYDIYRFTQGYSGGAKAGRAFAEGVADVMTLGVAEIITTPVESIADGNLMAYEVSYDSTSLVDQVTPLTASIAPVPSTSTEVVPASNPQQPAAATPQAAK
jgi:hypothetical protein